MFLAESLERVELSSLGASKGVPESVRGQGQPHRAPPAPGTADSRAVAGGTCSGDLAAISYHHMVVDHGETLEAAERRTDRVFNALADRTRRDILRQAMDGVHSVSALARFYPMSFAAVQKHVTVLERAGLVTKHRRGREQLVLTDIGAVRAAQHLLDQLDALWRSRIDRLTEVLAEPTEGANP